MKAKPEVVELDRQELESLLDRIQAVMGPEVVAPFRQLLLWYVELLEIIRNKRISLRRLQQLLFGARTERRRNVTGTNGRSSADRTTSFPETDGGEETPPGQGKGKESAGRPPAKGHGRNGAGAYTGCQTVVVEHSSLHGGAACPSCGGAKVYEQKEPATVVRLVGQAPVAGTVYHLRRFRCELCGEVFTAELPPEAGPDKYDPTAVSMMALLRYGYGMPLNRLASLQQSLGIPLPASTQWEQTSEGAYRLEPVFQHLILEGAQGHLVHNDDTMMRVLELMDEKTRRQALEDTDADRRGIFTTSILSITEGHSIALFFTGTRHAGENLREVLARRAEQLQPPIQMCDALARNMPEDLRVIVANCLCHGRRRFVELDREFPDEVTHVLECLSHVYQIDARAKDQQLSPDERLRLHQEHSGPVMDELYRWLNDQFDQRKVEPNSALGQAIRYMLKHWAKLTLFLRQPGAPLDNNVCEQALKKAIRHRKNSLFYKTQRGAHVGDLFMSLIHTCYLCGADPFDYLTQVLRQYEQAARDPGQWMPWNYKAQIVSAETTPARMPTTGSAPTVSTETPAAGMPLNGEARSISAGIPPAASLTSHPAPSALAGLPLAGMAEPSPLAAASGGAPAVVMPENGPAPQTSAGTPPRGRPPIDPALSLCAGRPTAGAAEANPTASPSFASPIRGAHTSGPSCSGPARTPPAATSANRAASSDQVGLRAPGMADRGSGASASGRTVGAAVPTTGPGPSGSTSTPPAAIPTIDPASCASVGSATAGMAEGNPATSASIGSMTTAMPRDGPVRPSSHPADPAETGQTAPFDTS